MFYDDECIEIYLIDKQEILVYLDKTYAKLKLLDLFRSGYGVMIARRVADDVSKYLCIYLSVMKE